MILLSVDGVAKHFGPEPVLDGASFEIRPGDKAGLVGPNGAGKTTLLKIVAGMESADAGAVTLHSSARLGFLEQQPNFPSGSTVWDEAARGLAHLTALAHEAEEVAHAIAAASDAAERDRLARRFDRLQVELHRLDAYTLDHQIERVLDGLQFRRDNFRQPVEQLSGGQQNRLLLAQLLLSQADLLLLDEPSNHLDIEATEWLENFLAENSQALLVVSHDRYFLDKVTNRTLELFHGTVDSYPGNSSAYWRQKAERNEVARRTYEKQQEQIAKTEDFIRRDAYGQKHAQAKDREKKLARIERVDPPRDIAAPAMFFPAAARSGDLALRAEHLTKGYGRPQCSHHAPRDGIHHAERDDYTCAHHAERDDNTYRPLFDDLSFDILRGQRWGVLGPNGSGKTTLLRVIVGEEKANRGGVYLGTGVKIGYYDQRLRFDDESQQVVDAIRPGHKEFNEPQRRSLLARFGLTGDMVFQAVGSLSGGKRSRAALAQLAAADANFLVLDEPTNHLDLWARDALERALLEFDGTVLFVSHDRYFLNRVADHLLVVEPGRMRAIEGNYELYQHLVRTGLAEEATSVMDLPSAKPADDRNGRDAERPSSRAPSEKPARPKRRFPYRKVADLEAEIFDREARVEQLHVDLTQPEVLRDGRRVREIQAEIDSQQESLETLYEHWEEATELNG